jgi:hypothetical protein
MPKAETKASAAEFSSTCFKTHGRLCYFHGKKATPKRQGPGEGCLKDATDPMHVIGRAHLGPKARYACAEENSRPGCRNCHDLQEAGRLEFPLAVRRRAVIALNKVMKQPIHVPEE